MLNHNFSLAILSILLLISMAFASHPMISDDEENRTTSMQKSDNTTTLAARNNFDKNETAVTCYDPHLAVIINTGLRYYSHNMGQLASYILTQIKSARFPGFWLVHAEMINGPGQHQGVEWQSLATGDIFSETLSRHGCYVHNGQTFVIVLQY